MGRFSKNEGRNELTDAALWSFKKRLAVPWLFDDGTRISPYFKRPQKGDPDGSFEGIGRPQMRGPTWQFAQERPWLGLIQEF